MILNLRDYFAVPGHKITNHNPVGTRASFLIPANDLPKPFPRSETRCAIIVRIGDARMRVVEERAGEIGILTQMEGGGRGPGGAKHMRADRNTNGGTCAGSDYICHLFIGYW